MGSARGGGSAGLKTYITTATHAQLTDDALHFSKKSGHISALIRCWLEIYGLDRGKTSAVESGNLKQQIEIAWLTRWGGGGVMLHSQSLGRFRSCRNRPPLPPTRTQQNAHPNISAEKVVPPPPKKSTRWLTDYSHRHELIDELRKRIAEFIHELNQCTVPCGGVHTCFSIGPPIRPGTRKWFCGWIHFGNSGGIQFVSGVDGPQRHEHPAPLPNNGIPTMWSGTPPPGQDPLWAGTPLPSRLWLPLCWDPLSGPGPPLLWAGTPSRPAKLPAWISPRLSTCNAEVWWKRCEL